MSLHSGASPKPPTDNTLTRAPGPADRAVLVLEDGRTFEGRAYGARGHTLGEAVFATGMTGYQETLTDPSYAGQIVMMTAPHIGNTGMNDTDTESAQIWVAGFVVRDPSRVVSNFRAQRSLDDDLIAAGVVGISGIDTRALTRHPRSAGAMRAGIFSGDALSLTADPQRDAVPKPGGCGVHGRAVHAFRTGGAGWVSRGARPRRQDLNPHPPCPTRV